MYSLVGLFLIDHVYITTTKSHEAAGYENLRNASHLLQMTTVFLCLPKATTPLHIIYLGQFLDFI